jgi:osmoprotectant transport system ATP-binding protein
MSSAPGREADPVVAWRGVVKAYPGGQRALDGVDLEVAPGSCLAILGTSGSGKTTLLKTINRLIEPTEGTVSVRGRPAADWDPIALRRSIGYVIQDVGLMPHMNILDNVALVLRLLGRPRGERSERAEALLDLVGMAPARFARRRPHELSGGQRQRVGVARALAADPDLVLMDEPFGALDPITRRTLQDEFDALRRRLGKTVVLVTHDVREAVRLADRVAVMDHGRVVQVGTPAEVMEAPASPFVAAFFEEARAVDEPAAEPHGPAS